MGLLHLLLVTVLGHRKDLLPSFLEVLGLFCEFFLFILKVELLLLLVFVFAFFEVLEELVKRLDVWQLVVTLLLPLCDASLLSFLLGKVDADALQVVFIILNLCLLNRNTLRFSGLLIQASI